MSDLREKVADNLIKVWMEGQTNDPTGMGAEALTDRILPLVEAAEDLRGHNCSGFSHLCVACIMVAALDKFWKGAE